MNRRATNCTTAVLEAAAEISLFAATSRMVLGPTEFSIQWLPAAITTECEAGRSAFTPPYVYVSYFV